MLPALCPSKSRGAACEQGWQCGPVPTGPASQAAPAWSSALGGCVPAGRANKVVKFHFTPKSRDEARQEMATGQVVK